MTDILQRESDSNEFENLDNALAEIRAEKFKLQARLRALQTREWQVMDDIQARRQVARAKVIPMAPVADTKLANRTIGETFNNEHYRRVQEARSEMVEAKKIG